MGLANITEGLKVLFGRPNGEKTEGVVEGFTRGKRVKVRQTEERGDHPVGTIWRVAPAAIYPVGGSTAAPATKPEATVGRDARVRSIASHYGRASDARELSTETYGHVARQFFSLVDSGAVTPDEIADGIRLALRERTATHAA